MTYAIVKKETDELIGTINLMMNKTHKKAEVGYWVGLAYWGNGYCTEAFKSIVEFGFKNFDLNKIFGLSLVDNIGSWRVMEKSGMTYEGTRRQDVVKNDIALDLKSYSILREEYLNNSII